MTRAILDRRLTGRHGVTTISVIDDLLQASCDPSHAFEILERVAEREPLMKSALLRAANSAPRRAIDPIRRTRQALVRIGLVTASEVMLHAANRETPTRLDAA